MTQPHDTRHARPAAQAALDPPSAAMPVPVEHQGEPVQPLLLVQEGWSGEGIFFYLAGWGGAAVAVWLGMDLAGLIRTPGEAARALGLIAAGGIAAFFPLRRRLLRYRHEYRLDAEGISLWQSDPPTPEREWTRIPWTEIVELDVSTRPGEVRVAAVGSDWRWIALHEARPRPGTVEFARRLAREAERHPRVPLEPAEKHELRGAPILGVQTLGYAVTAVALVWGGLVAQDRLGFSLAVQRAGLVVCLAAYLGVRLWLQLDDSDIAHADRGSRAWKSRLRNRLRTLFGIRLL